MFGKIMSISDDLMWNYYELLSSRSLKEIEDFKVGIANNTVNPRDVKIALAKEIITRYHGEEAAETAHNDFTTRFSKNAIPDDIDEKEVSLNGETAIGVANLLKNVGLVASTSEAIRMINQKAVKKNGEAITDPKLMVEAGEAVWQVGKRKFAKVIVK
jgi:tyrosyl-tRNA synthetase